MAKRKITLDTLAVQMAGGFTKQGKEIRDLTKSVAFVVKHMAPKDDIAEIRSNMAHKDQIVAPHEQVTSIAAQLRGMKHTKLQARVADLEEKVFGRTRA